MSISSMARKSIHALADRFGLRLERKYDFGQYRLDVLELVVDRLEPERPDFIFIQIGANDGITSDQIHDMVEQYQWYGLLLEPQPDAFAQLVRNYAGQDQLIFENVALAATDGHADLWTVPGHPGLASFERSVLRRAGYSEDQIERLTVPTICVESLLERHGIQAIDLLQIDTEGFDFEVIKMFLSTGILPAAINYEHLHLSNEDRESCVALLGSLGYKLVQAGPQRIDTVAYRPKGLTG